ncbi:DNA-binding response regulator, OmpR family, contains REC and winged-helix (wHTH) domain [Anaerocolumna jejuensis DSM 15929]|uniref:Stage 0 sporulation protein A homolog n=1 Tax=Anaerocolumna jejuensis DSM 15929 TaxID=1121322 RepID=A0A1M7CT46_9FIRM|nr:response regulator transcription factor [Anaerocolumna jejuensis]SHL70385.1 DNA-binding response regulator, OmpR family, contains REC and winged-helix (wHTH) domain [Anaerocolumna jejuensis DSM 15929]
MEENKKRILVVEDEEKIMEFIESYLINSGYEVIKAYSGRAAESKLREERLDMLLLDLMLPDKSGEEILRNLRKESRIPVIILTAKSSEESVINGLDIGADDYITKPFSPRQMVARVNALFRRSEKGESGETLSFRNGKLMINLENYRVMKEGEDILLTPSEFKLLTTLAKRNGKVFTREELIMIAFDGDYAGFDRTIDSHIKNLRAKLEDNPKEPEYILTIRGVGYKFGGD